MADTFVLRPASWLSDTRAALCCRQAVLHEAERQLLLVRDDMVTVKRRQVELSGKLIKHPQATQRK